MISSLGSMLKDAQKKRFAVGAFNVLSLEYAIGLIEAAEAVNSPIILQISPSVISLFGLQPILTPCLSLAEKSKIPVCVHLDHGKSRSQVVESINNGFSSVMFDGSSLPFHENVQETQYLSKVAHEKNISIEAEIGKVGKEEDVTSEDSGEMKLSNLEEVVKFVHLTNVDALAVSIGSIHGVKQPHINLEINLLQSIRNEISVPLVLHGSSGVTDDSIISAIKAGITKINVATRLKVKVAQAIYTIYKNQGMSGFIDSSLLSNTIIDSVKEEALNRIHLFTLLRY